MLVRGIGGIEHLISGGVHLQTVGLTNNQRGGFLDGVGLVGSVNLDAVLHAGVVPQRELIACLQGEHVRVFGAAKFGMLELLRVKPSEDGSAGVRGVHQRVLARGQPDEPTGHARNRDVGGQGNPVAETFTIVGSDTGKRLPVSGGVLMVLLHAGGIVSHDYFSM